MKSLQNSLNELFHSLALPLVTNAAFSKARHNLSHTAFIELNEETLVRTIYEHEHHRFSGLRLLAIDGSKVILPQSDGVIEAFGSQSIQNQRGVPMGTYSYGLSSVLYDVLNGVALDATLHRGDIYEVDAAQRHLTHAQRGDLLIFDRGYCAFRMLSLMAQTKADFLIRCHHNSFKAVNAMFESHAIVDLVTTIAPNQKYREHYGDAQPVRVRLVRIVLKTGEVEVVATSLMDTVQYPPSVIAELYWKRWGIESFYNILKSRLGLENFSGYSVESILQEFHATVFLTGLESQLIEDADTRLAQKPCANPQQVNHCTSFNAIKSRAFDLLLSDIPIDTVLDELTALFLKRPLVIVLDKNPPRKLSSATLLLNFWRRRRKSVF